ncbi:MAG: hypothetical protein R3B06_18280 [Kofleriaceae bacterium]
MSDRAYKRSWKNLLLNKQYQLRFTLFLVGVAALLMGLLGWWAIKVAQEATTVAKSAIRAKQCNPDAVAVAPSPGAAVAAPPVVAPPPVAPAAGGPAGPDPTTPPAVAGGVGDAPVAPADPTAGTEEPHRHVVIEQSSMTMVTPPPVAPAPVSAGQSACEQQIVSDLAAADARFRHIILVLVISGVVLVIGLTLMGIKMTHRVAGPLHKVGLYLAKLERGHYDKVYDLRKGDQLVEFYEHFKHAHAGVVALEREDVAQLRAALAAAEASPAASRPEVAAAITALRETLARKEASLVG